MEPQFTIKEKIYNFFENPKGFWAWFVQFVIFVLIILSVYIFIIEFFYPELYGKHEKLYWDLNLIILGVFTVEYVLRFATAPGKGKFFVKPMNLVDFFAVFPNYIELILHVAFDTRELRILRLLRLTRILRAFKLFHFAGAFKKVFSYQNTILQSITPVIAIFAALKGPPVLYPRCRFQNQGYYPPLFFSRPPISFSGWRPLHRSM